MTTPTQNSTLAEVVSVSGNNDIASLVYGTRWVGQPDVVLTYSFPGPGSSWAPSYSQLDEPGGLQPFGVIETDAARLALQTWSRYADLTFTETNDLPTSVGDLRFAYSSVSAEDFAAHAYLPGNSPNAGDVWLDSATNFRSFDPGSFGFLALLHEIGHSLGLKHPFETAELNMVTVSPQADSISNTIMSYNIFPEFSLSEFALSYYPTTPMPFDIAAIRAIYGAVNFNTGDNIYIYNENLDYFETIYDTGGNDTIVWNSEEQFAIIDLLGGNWSSFGKALLIYDQFGELAGTDIYNVTIYRSTVIENVISGNSDDDIYGNEVANRLEAGGGHDIVWGDAGADTLLGGGGNDHLYGQSPVGGPDGSDSISGGDGGDYIQGNAGNDMLDGGEGSDRINGGADTDYIFGMAGNDTVNGNRGDDTISGGDGNDSLRGGQGADLVSGGAGNDILSGDLGADTLSGGEGADLFVMGPAASVLGQGDQIDDFVVGFDRLSIGFIPAALLTGTSDPGSGGITAQSLLDGRFGNGEVAAIMIGRDTYLFYAADGGATIDSTILLVGVAAPSFTLAEFA